MVAFVRVPGLEDWSPEQKSMATSHAIGVKEILEEAERFLTILFTGLDDERRAAVEMTAWLDAASKVARDELAIGADDFALAALEVFTSV
jgi:hypothetical protein